MKYKITYFSSFNEPYYNSVNKTIAQHDNYESWTFDNKDDCMSCLKDMMDIPESTLTLEQIKDDFSSDKYPISDDKANEIKDYYNGRLDIYNKIKTELDNDSDMTAIHYDIAEKYNTFAVADEYKVKQIDSFIEVQKLK